MILDRVVGKTDVDECGTRQLQLLVGLLLGARATGGRGEARGGGTCVRSNW